MKTLTTDNNNDIFVSRGRLAVSEEFESVMQCCEHAVQAQLGEMVLAADRGVPNFQTIWSDSTNVAQFEAYLRRAIMSVENVTGIKSLTVKVQNNQAIYSAEIETSFGNGVIGNGV